MNASDPHSGVDRRRFLERSARNAAIGVAAGLSSWLPAQAGAVEPIRIGVIGLRSRGKELIGRLNEVPEAEIAALCDIDAAVLNDVAAACRPANGTRVELASDYRRLLDDPRLQAVIVATPDHWHATLTAQACLAGKDVYVESPAVHDRNEWRTLLDVVKSKGRIVQTGLQQRSGASVQSAVDLVRSGEIGVVRFARAWMACRRKPIGRRGDSAAPAGVDYAAWLGPAGNRPFNSNRFHANWSRFWDYGAGELGLWGVHWLDVAAWALAPQGECAVQAVGSRLQSNDDQQTPDTLTIHYQFGGPRPVEIVWEHRTWTVHGNEGRTSGIAFYGDEGTLVLDRGGWKIYDRRDSRSENVGDLDGPHLANFMECIRTRLEPAASLERVACAERMCHAGIRAWREDRMVTENFAEPAARIG